MKTNYKIRVFSAVDQITSTCVAINRPSSERGMPPNIFFSCKIVSKFELKKHFFLEFVLEQKTFLIKCICSYWPNHFKNSWKKGVYKKSWMYFKNVITITARRTVRRTLQFRLLKTRCYRGVVVRKIDQSETFLIVFLPTPKHVCVHRQTADWQMDKRKSV